MDWNFLDSRDFLFGHISREQCVQLMEIYSILQEGTLLGCHFWLCLTVQGQSLLSDLPVTGVTKCIWSRWQENPLIPSCPRWSQNREFHKVLGTFTPALLHKTKILVRTMDSLPTFGSLQQISLDSVSSFLSLYLIQQLRSVMLIISGIFGNLFF